MDYRQFFEAPTDPVRDCFVAARDEVRRARWHLAAGKFEAALDAFLFAAALRRSAKRCREARAMCPRGMAVSA